MKPQLQEFLRELAAFGQEHDAQQTVKTQKMLNITPNTGCFLAILVQQGRARRVLEIGTSNGYSTIWLADAVRQTGGRVDTIELLPAKAALAQQNFQQAGVADWITLYEGEAGAVLCRQEAACYDLIFLDAKRTEYSRWWPELQRVLRPGGVLVVDNAVSHAAELADFQQMVASDARYLTVLLPLGKGEFVALKQLAEDSQTYTI